MKTYYIVLVFLSLLTGCSTTLVSPNQEGWFDSSRGFVYCMANPDPQHGVSRPVCVKPKEFDNRNFVFPEK